MATAEPEDPKYSAFISYSHKDSRLAIALQRQLESYKLPPKVGCQWRPKNDRLYPVFRDSSELPASSDLGAVLRGDLTHSSALIVICSAAAAESRWVEEEIRYFVALGRSNRIFAVIAEGEPPACFPSALLDTCPHESLSGHSEPLGADLRSWQARGRAPRARVREERLRLIAGLVGAGLEDLTQRDRRRRRRRSTLGALAAIFLVASSSVGFLWQRQRYEKRARRSVVQELLNKGQRQLLAGDPFRALPYLSAAFREDRSNRDLRLLLARAMAPLDARRFVLTDVLRAAFAPGGEILLTVNENGTVTLRRATDGSALRDLSPPPARIADFSFSPDGAILGTISENVGQLWATSTGRCQATLAGHELAIKTIRISRSHRWAATSSVDNTARIWDAATGSLVHKLRGHSASVIDAEFSPDSERLVTLGNDGSARMWDVESGRLLWIVRYQGILLQAQFSPTGEEVLLFGSQMGGTRAKLYRSDGSLIASLDRPYGLLAAGFSHDAKRALAVTTDDRGKSYKVWSVSDNNVVYTLGGGPELETYAQFSPDGSKLVTAGFDNLVKIWNTATGGAEDILSVPTAGNPISGAVQQADFSYDGETVLLVTGGHEMSLWSLAGSHLVLAGHDRGVADVEFSPDGSRLLSSDHKTLIVRTSSGRILFRLKPSYGVLRAIFDPAGKRILTTSPDKNVQIWSAADGKLLYTLEGHDREVRAAAFSPDGAAIATAGADGRAILWDAKNGTQLRVFRKTELPMTSVAFSPDGGSLLLTSMDGSVVLLDRSTGLQICSLAGSSDLSFPSARFSPRGNLLFVGGMRPGIWSRPCQLRMPLAVPKGASIAAVAPDGEHFVTTAMGTAPSIWTSKTGRLQATLQTYNILSSTVSFSPDGGWLLTSGVDKADLWNSESGRRLLTIGGPAQTGGAAFSPKGDWLAVGSADGTLELMRIGLESRDPERIDQRIRLFVPWELRQGTVFRRTEPMAKAAAVGA